MKIFRAEEEEMMKAARERTKVEVAEFNARKAELDAQLDAQKAERDAQEAEEQKSHVKKIHEMHKKNHRAFDAIGGTACALCLCIKILASFKLFELPLM